MLKFHHVGIAVKDIEHSSQQYKNNFQAQIVYESDIVYDQIQDASLKIITIQDGTSVEFVSGRIVESLLKRKVDVYHVCYESDDFHTDTERLKSTGAVAISMPSPATLFNNRIVQFFMTDYGMVEILEG